MIPPNTKLQMVEMIHHQLKLRIKREMQTHQKLENTRRDSREYHAYTDLNFIKEVMLKNAKMKDLEMIQQFRIAPP